VTSFLTYWSEHSDKLVTALLQHLEIVGVTLGVSLMLAIIITLLLAGHRRASSVVMGVLGAVYSIPSLALFALLIPVLGIGFWPAIVVLVAYNQFLLVRNFLAGFDAVDDALIEAARGLGMTRVQVLVRVRLPLAFPVILAGVHLAVVSTIGIATIASVINAGGLGTILFEGLRTNKLVKLVWGTVLAGGLAVVANALLVGIEAVAKRRLHYE
jgi:osmoprotectant transport system permease protein